MTFSANQAATGVSGLDDVLQGGLSRGHDFLLEGEPGAGKTTIAAVHLRGREDRRKVSLHHLVRDRGRASSGRCIPGLDPGARDHPVRTIPPENLLDEEQQHSLLYSSDLELGETTRLIFAAVEHARPSRVVLDSLSEIRLLAQSSLRYRRTAHGFVAWALASVLGAAVLAAPATSILGGTAAGVTQGAVARASQSAGPMDGYVDTPLRGDPAATTPAGNSADARGEVIRLFTRSFRDGGELKSTDREYAAKVIAARVGMSQPDAEKRVNDVITQIKADADATRKATASLAFWLTASLLLGAFCASLAATEGGGLRDGTWKRRG